MIEEGEYDWDGEQFYRVEKILDYKEQGGKAYYLVKWEGWDVKTSTWEEEKNVAHLRPLIKNFHNSRRHDEGRNAHHKRITQIEAGMSPYQATNHHGHMLYGDAPQRIKKLEVVSVGGRPTTYFEVEWKRREDGFLPDNSMIESRALAEHCPTFVFDFYHSRVRLMIK